MLYLTTKGLFARALGGGRYVLGDVFGVCTMPFFAVDIDEVSKIANSIALVSILCSEDDLNSMASPKFANWFRPEKYYVAGISDHYRYWQVGRNLVAAYDKFQLRSLLLISSQALAAEARTLLST